MPIPTPVGRILPLSGPGASVNCAWRESPCYQREVGIKANAGLGSTARSSSRASALVRFVIVVGTIAFACGRQPSTCEPLTFSPLATAQYAEIRTTLEFAPTLPCSFRSDIEVVRVFDSVVPSGSPQQRLSFVAERRGTRGFVLSATPAEVPFTAIPQGTHRLRTVRADVTAAGFAGPSGGGEEIAYLRWRIEGVTYELAATLQPWLTEDDVQAIAGALIGAQEPAQR